MTHRPDTPRADCTPVVESPSSRSFGWAWLCVAALLGAGALAGWAADPAWLDWQAARVASQPRRLWTAAFVHLSALHLGANLAGTVLVGALGARAQVPPRFALAWLIAWPLTHAALLLQPALTHYAGLSGVLHAGVGVVAMHLLLDGRRWLGAALSIGLPLKLLSDTPWRGAVQQVPGWDVGVAPFAHVCGALAGVGVALSIAAICRRREPPPTPRARPAAPSTDAPRV